MYRVFREGKHAKNGLKIGHGYGWPLKYEMILSKSFRKSEKLKAKKDTQSKVCNS